MNDKYLEVTPRSYFYFMIPAISKPLIMVLLPIYFYYFLDFYFTLQLINNLVFVLGTQQSEQVIHILVTILFSNFFPI